MCRNTLIILALTHIDKSISDYVMVTLEHRTYNVSEGEALVKVCGVLNTSNVIDCAVNYNFRILINVYDIGAGRK